MPEVTQIAPVKVLQNWCRTKITKQVKVTYNTGKEANEAVRWNEIDPDAYKEPGTFEVDGTLENTQTSKQKPALLLLKTMKLKKATKSLPQI